MVNIDDAIDLFTKFFDAEFKVQEANYANNATAFARRYAAMRKMIKDPLVHEIHPVDHTNLKGMRKAAIENTKKVLAPRQIFLVEQHDLSARKKLFCAYASVDRVPDKVTSYAMKFWADKSLRIVATHWHCSECSGLGTLNGSTCKECSGRGWLKSSGVDGLTKLGKATAVKKLLRPTWPRHAEHYDEVA